MTAQWNFKDKVIAVTGAASGMGLGICELMAASGAKVSMADIQEKLLAEAAEKLREKTGAKILTRVVDVRDSQQVNAWIEETVKTLGKLDGAANVAGVLAPGHHIDRIYEETDKNWAFVVDVNLTGMLYSVRAEINAMNPEGGAIVNVSSIASMCGYEKQVSYVATKHGVNGITKAAALDAANKNIRVNCIAPGPIETPMGHESAAKRGGEWFPLTGPIKRRGRTSEVADLAAFLLADTSSYITGAIHVIDGGWSV